LINLKGISWDHKRGYDPLVKTAEEFHKIHPDICVSWAKRSLREFGNYSVEKLAEAYDLLIIDHPFSGEAFSKNLYVHLDTCIDSRCFERIKRQEIGKVFQSYNYEGRQMAFPVDAAAIVSASRDDMLAANGLHRPQTLREVFLLREKLPKSVQIYTALCPVDIWCVFLSLCAAETGAELLHSVKGFDENMAQRQMETLRRLAGISGGNPFEMDPIVVLDAMAQQDDVAYSPFLFGYVNYSIKGNYRNTVNFYDAPLWKDAKSAPILGGAGIAISANCNSIDAAAKYVEYVCQPDVQQNIYFFSGGQPGQRDAWLSEENNRISNGFFKNTLRTIENAYLRPRNPGWNTFQEIASEILCEGVLSKNNPKNVIQKINELFQLHVREGES
jgi:multiple sugar transport system substrate-binding protein